jgi:thiol-disulfide isomerase/thioredoxin
MVDASGEKVTVSKKIDAKWGIRFNMNLLKKFEKTQKSGEENIIIGQPFPELEFKDLNGDVMNIANLKGKVVLIDFWATWCGPCRKETPNLLSVYKEFRDKGFEIIGISLDKNLDTLKNYLEDHQIQWPQYYDGKGWDNAISRRFGVNGIPSTVLIDREGVVRYLDVRGTELEMAVASLFDDS